MKKRTPHICIKTNEDLNLNWNSEKNCLELLNSDGEISDKHLVSIGESYDRVGKNPKILRLVKNPTGGVININKTAEVYNRHLAIDTSYKPFGNNYICTTAAIVMLQDFNKKKGFKKGEKIDVLIPPRLIFLAKPGNKPERYGWMKFIEGLIRSDIFNKNWLYGVTVDSDLDAVQKINAQEESIFKDFFIPPNIHLIYASADSGRNVFVNKLIRATDQVAKKSLETAMKNYEGQENFSFKGDFFDLDVLTGRNEINF